MSSVHITPDDERYPALLHDLTAVGRWATGPCRSLDGITMEGDLELLRSPMVGLVGPRRASAYSLHLADLAGKTAAQEGLTLVCSPSVGCGWRAARSALDEGGQVILTMMSGTSYPYPTTSTDVIEAARERGLILGGEGEQGAPTKDATARRDSIFLALLAQSQAPLIVCGAAMPSGTTRVMEAAADLGLGVLAFPGPITDRCFDGTNYMIAHHGASLVTNPSAALEAEALRQLTRREARERLGMTGLESEMHAAIELQDPDRAGDGLKPTQPPIGT